MIQKLYLGVGKVITASEARALLNRAGADLDEVMPQLEEPDDAPIEHEEQTQ